MWVSRDLAWLHNKVQGLLENYHLLFSFLSQKQIKIFSQLFWDLLYHFLEQETDTICQFLGRKSWIPETEIKRQFLEARNCKNVSAQWTISPSDEVQFPFFFNKIEQSTIKEQHAIILYH